MKVGEGTIHALSEHHKGTDGTNLFSGNHENGYPLAKKDGNELNKRKGPKPAARPVPNTNTNFGSKRGNASYSAAAASLPYYSHDQSDYNGNRNNRF